MIPAGDENIRIERTFVNNILILLNIAVYILMVFRPDILLPGATSYDEIVYRLGMIPIFVVNGERLWSIFTSMFIHAGLAHLLGNMLYLYVFGDNIEAAMGRLRYLVFYLLSGLGAVVFHIVSISVLPPESLLNRGLSTANPWVIPAVGASGAISGVLGAYLMMYPGGIVRTVSFFFWIPVVLRVPAALFIIVWFIYQLVMGIFSLTTVSTGIAFWAHIGGFLTGIALVPILTDKKRLRKLRFYSYWYQSSFY
ncbi:MAG: rhomboid family intramembrane serine protease [Fervidicoccaceae archaeon]|jgi:membrane associated rhomboid family serine protease|nr:rhomboid family intramembrane serine protease [Fervidicoccaceae archaeon]